MQTSIKHRLYALAVTLLGLSAVGMWAWLSAQVQQRNADQLVDGFLFENAHTFASAIFPASHTQVIKWPLFALLHWFGFSVTAYDGLTVALALITVAGFGYVLYRLEHRPLRFAALFLVFVAMLMLIPAQIFDGVTSPLNLAMLTGRNVEYLVYLGILALWCRTTTFKSWHFIGASLLLGLLIASDHLFTMLSLGGAGVFCVVAWVLGHRQLQAIARFWLVGGGVAWLLAAALQLIIGQYTHVVNDALPYGIIKTLPQLWQSLSGTVGALGLNFGLVIRGESWVILPVVFNTGIVIVMLCALVWLVRSLLHEARTAQPSPAQNTALPVMLMSTFVAATVVFAVVNQPHLNNARYLTIGLFAGFVTLAVYQRGRQFSSRPIVIASGFAALSLVLGLAATWHHTHAALARDQLHARNQQIVRALAQHPVELLAGNYWRVMPIRLLSPSARQAVVPLDGCLRPTRLLGSMAWQPDLRTHSFAYLLSVQGSEVPGTRCSRQLIISRYGKPTSVQIVSGTAANPTEELLFYDRGATYSRP